MIWPFEDDRLGSSDEEFGRLSIQAQWQFVAYLNKVERKLIDRRFLATFWNFRGVELFQCAVGDEFIVISVEDIFEGKAILLNEAKVMLMFAGRHGQSAKAGPAHWDGQDYAAFKAGILHHRCLVTFV